MLKLMDKKEKFAILHKKFLYISKLLKDLYNKVASVSNCKAFIGHLLKASNLMKNKTK